MLLARCHTDAAVLMVAEQLSIMFSLTLLCVALVSLLPAADWHFTHLGLLLTTALQLQQGLRDRKK